VLNLDLLTRRVEACKYLQASSKNALAGSTNSGTPTDPSAAIANLSSRGREGELIVSWCRKGLRSRLDFLKCSIHIRNTSSSKDVDYMLQLAFQDDFAAISGPLPAAKLLWTSPRPKDLR